MDTVYISLILLILFNTGTANSCENDDDCKDIIGSTCIMQECKCNEHHVVSADRSQCLLIVTDSQQECIDTMQCSSPESKGQGSICGPNKKCICNKGFHYRDGKCYRTKTLGEPCVQAFDCYDGYDHDALSCKDGVCSCSDNYFQRSNIDCRPKAASNGNKCILDIDCQNIKKYCDNSLKCSKKKRKQYVVIQDWNTLNDIYNGKLQMIKYNNSKKSYGTWKVIGSNCKADEDCQIDNAICLGKCFCKTGYTHLTINDTNEICAAELGGKANNKDECLLEKSEYRNGKCACRVGFSYSHDNFECIKATQNISYSCLDDVNCRSLGPGAKCIQKKCVCDDTAFYDEDNMICRNPVKLGTKCNNVVECALNELVSPVSPVCLNNICGCPSNSHAIGDSVCQKDKPKPGDKCFQETECKKGDEHSKCDEKTSVCVCEEKYYNKNGECHPGVGTACEIKVNKCTLEHSECIEGFCKCIKGYQNITSTCIHIAEKENATCTDDVECWLGLGNESMCIEGACKCNDGYFYNYNKCWQKRMPQESCASAGECYIESSPDTIECRNSLCQCIIGHHLAKDNRPMCQQTGAGSINLYSMNTLIAVILFTLYVY